MNFLLVILASSLLSAVGLAQSPKAPLKGGASDSVARIADLKKRLAVKPGDVRMNLELGRLLLNSGQAKDAVFYLRAASSNPTKESISLLAAAYGKTGDSASELRTLESLMKKYEDDPEAHELLARCYAKQKNQNKASAEFRKSMQLDPTRRSAHEGLLDLFILIHNNYETRVLVSDMMKKFGNNSRLQSELCRVSAEDNYFNEAIEACQKAIKMNPKIAENHVHLGRTYRLAQKEKQSNEVIAQAAKQFPDSELAQLTAGELYDEQKNWETSVHFYKRCATAHPKSARCLYKLGVAEFELKEYATSLDAFEKACQLDQLGMKDFRRVTSQLRIQNKTDWMEKFAASVDRCSLNARRPE